MSGPRIAWILIDDYGAAELLHEEPRHYSGRLVQIVYWEVSHE